MRCVEKKLDEWITRICVEEAVYIAKSKANGEDHDEAHDSVDGDSGDDGLWQGDRRIFDLLRW